MEEMLMHYMKKEVQLFIELDKANDLIFVTMFKGRIKSKTAISNLCWSAFKTYQEYIEEAFRMCYEVLVHHERERAAHIYEDEPQEEVKWKCILCQSDGCPLGKCLFERKQTTSSE